MAHESSVSRIKLNWAAILIAALFAGGIAALLADSSVARRFGLMGAEHILLGFDHLAFVAMLLIGAAQFRSLLFVVTSFTVAHSITLSAAALGWIVPSAAWVEPVIILTILYVAIENLLTANPTARVGLTFAFGLIHGMGFAFALSEGPLPHNEEMIALLSFNLGVEAGQISFLALTYPLWRLAQARGYGPIVRRLTAGVVVLLGVMWLTQRI